MIISLRENEDLLDLLYTLRNEYFTKNFIDTNDKFKCITYFNTISTKNNNKSWEELLSIPKTIFHKGVVI
jgi:hypothetical protein